MRKRVSVFLAIVRLLGISLGMLALRLIVLARIGRLGGLISGPIRRIPGRLIGSLGNGDLDGHGIRAFFADPLTVNVPPSRTEQSASLASSQVTLGSASNF